MKRKKTMDATQHKQKIPFNMDVIFKAFHVFIVSFLNQEQTQMRSNQRRT